MSIIVGIDEVGRGCWAGPLVAGACLLDKPIDCLRDSKKLSKIKRGRLDVDIRCQAVAIGLGWVTPQEIDEHGLTWAVSTAMWRAITELHSQQPNFTKIIIDGNINYLQSTLCESSDLSQSYLLNSDRRYINPNVRGRSSHNVLVGVRGGLVEVETMVGADDKVPAVSAASIVAKVARDNYMIDQAKKYPNYGFDEHVGYGTAKHREALSSLGVTDLHRQSFKPIAQLVR